MEIPTYKQALARHETPLDTFVSRWEPVEKTDKKNFREDLAALIAYIESTPVQAPEFRDWFAQWSSGNPDDVSDLPLYEAMLAAWLAGRESRKGG